MNTYKVKYKHKFPVDSEGQLGGCYSDRIATSRKELTRDGVLVKQDSKKKLYIVEDIELKKEFIVPFEKVTVLAVS